MSEDDRQTLKELERRLLTLLPEEYRERYEDVQPVSMGSAGLAYGVDGRVAWNAMWASFCDLALAGGPPHKGTLLEPASPREIDANPERHAEVIAEICRGIAMVTGLAAAASPDPGWVRVSCHSPTMSQWLRRTIAMENVAARADGAMLDLPAGPGYRVDKETKNVITAIAKTTHYWLEHMSLPEWQAIGALFDGMNDESPLVEPAYGLDGVDVEAQERLADVVAETISGHTGLTRAPHRCEGWVGIDCGTVHAAVWMMRMMAAVNVIARREQTALYVPVNQAVDPGGSTVVNSFTLVHRLAAGRGVC